jgi:MCP family monocarboxylic acid transporter-like MFS transporter 3
VWSFAIEAMIKRMGIEWTFRLAGAITLVLTLPASMFMRERMVRTAPFIDWYVFVPKNQDPVS